MDTTAFITLFFWLSKREGGWRVKEAEAPLKSSNIEVSPLLLYLTMQYSLLFMWLVCMENNGGFNLLKKQMMPLDLLMFGRMNPHCLLSQLISMFSKWRYLPHWCPVKYTYYIYRYSVIFTIKDYFELWVWVFKVTF